MVTRFLGLAFGVLALSVPVQAQNLTIPEGTTGFSPLEGEMISVEQRRVPLGDAVMGSETQVTLQFNLHGCLDSLMPLITHTEVDDDEVTFYVTALNAHNESSQVAMCVAMPQATAQVTVPGIFQENQIDVVYVNQFTP